MREIHKKKTGVRHLAKYPAAAALFGVVAGGAHAADAVLAPVEVAAPVANKNGTADTYVAPTVSVGRTKQDTRDVPQSITSITQQLMHDQDANTVKEALRNAVGVTFNAAEGGSSGDGIRIRGFAASNDLYVDNFRDSAQYNRDTFQTDSVEVLRGPASMIYGRGSTGGIVNQVSKQAFRGDLTQLTGTIGTDAFYRGEVDVNRSIGETAAARVVVMGQKGGSFREGAEMNRYGVAPSVKFGIGEQTEITLNALHYREDNVPDYGVPYYNVSASVHGTNTPIDRVNTFYGLKDFDSEKTKTDVLGAVIQHQIAPNMQLKNSTRYGQYDLDLRASAPSLRFANRNEALSDSTVIGRSFKLREREQEILSNVTDLIWDFETGTIRHDVLAGVELTREELVSFSRVQRNTGATTSCTAPTTTVGNPVTSGRPKCDEPVRTQADTSTANTAAIYFQDMISLNTQWKVLLGARYDNFKAETKRKSLTATPPNQPDVSRTDNVWSWRTGLIYQPDAQQSYYASYGTSFNPSAEAYSTDVRGSMTPPEKNANYEVGAKWTLLGGDLALRTALFRTIKTNERQTDIEVGVIKPAVLSGQRHTDGIELEGAGRITDKWQVFAGIAYMEAKIDKVGPLASQQANLGKRPDNVPSHTANFWTTYQIDGNWKVGGGFNAMGKRYTSLANVTNLPAFVRWDAMAEWKHRDLNVQLNVYNLFDTKHYEGLYGGFAVPGMSRSARVSVGYSF
ncbi:TonB-dependent siderophore receptor [Chitinibacter sp. FCG-7]|uniref:TonB-dependent siderophore receptor n=1 Tax=Chitinibacter mangrovi TaxID=3153927 RepID=A0AAU7F8W7_9NEIS